VAVEHTDERRERGAIVVLCPDVFFLVGIRNTVRRLGFEPYVVKSTDDLEEAASSLSPALVIIDMHALGSDGEWDAIGPYIKHAIPVLAFGPHKDVDAFRAAKEAGATRVVANSQFHHDMADLIERYASSPIEDAADAFDDVEDDEASVPPGTR
jgi:hypothetical protein